jgi:hypothetical protein
MRASELASPRPLLLASNLVDRPHDQPVDYDDDSVPVHRMGSVDLPGRVGSQLINRLPWQGGKAVVSDPEDLSQLVDRVHVANLYDPELV